MPSDASGIEPNLAAVAAHWERFGRAIAGTTALEAAVRLGQVRVPSDIARDALWFRTTTALETVRALQDTGGPELFRLLREIPLSGSTDTLCWGNLIAMRNLMVHQWWTIDETIVQETVRDDFPILGRLAESIRILDLPHDDDAAARAATESAPEPPLASVIYRAPSIGLTRLDL